MKPSDPGALLVRLADGRDPDALCELYTRTCGHVFAAALLVTGRRDAAEQVVQDLFVRIGNGTIAYARSDGAPMSFLIGLARRIAIEKSRGATDPGPTEGPRIDGSAARARERFTGEQVAPLCTIPALRKLTPQRRALLIAAYLFGEARADLVRRTGLNEVELRSEIRQMLQELGPSDEPPQVPHATDEAAARATAIAL